jgi:hypothetical protein
MLGQTCSGLAGFIDGPGGSWPIPAFWAGSGPEEKYQIFVGPRSAQHILGLSLAQFIGPTQPIYIIYYVYYIYINNTKHNIIYIIYNINWLGWPND